MEEMVKKATTDLTEEIIQLRAENMVYKTALDIADDNIKDLKKKLTKEGNKKAIAIGAALGVGIFGYRCWKKLQAERDYKRWKKETFAGDFSDDFGSDE